MLMRGSVQKWHCWVALADGVVEGRKTRGWAKAVEIVRIAGEDEGGGEFAVVLGSDMGDIGRAASCLMPVFVATSMVLSDSWLF